VSVADKSIAVLPFENLSEEKQNEFFVDGVQDKFSTDLAKNRRFESDQPQFGDAIQGRRRAQSARDWAAAWSGPFTRRKCATRCEQDSGERAANRCPDGRASVGADLRSRSADVFAIQSEIAKAIAEQLQAKLSPSEKAAIEKPPTTDLAAFASTPGPRLCSSPTLFIRLSSKIMREAIELLNHAVARDPPFSRPTTNSSMLTACCIRRKATILLPGSLW